MDLKTLVAMYSNPAPKVKLLCLGISKAEGFDVPGSLPARCHNPGDLEIGNVGYGVDNGKTIFPDDATGWAALYREGSLMLAAMTSLHRSHVYSLGETFLQVAQAWTGGDNPSGWAQTVAETCGMSVTNTLQEFLDA